MFKSKFGISQATRYQNAALTYYMGLTNSPFLNYGYWQPLPVAEELTIGRLRIAQTAYAAKLLAMIPAGVKTVLDVGCGIGGNAAYLLERGFKVEGLAPDPFQQERFLKATHDQAIFHLTDFESFRPSRTYDLILFSESSQYIAAHDIARAAGFLNRGGFLLMADMMRFDADYKQGMFSNCHVVKELEAVLKQAEFTLINHEDISAQITPTIDLYVENFQRFGLSTIQYIADLIAIAVPPLYKLLRWGFNRWLRHLVAEGLNARQIFEAHLCYQIQLWQLVTSEQPAGRERLNPQA